MPKLRPLSATEVCRILARNGFTRVRQSGSDSATVPVPNHREIAKGTLKSIIDLSGLDPQLFRK
jgi:predicted RNA binding protein YcfA (HicA-like mRNA interferase family)